MIVEITQEKYDELTKYATIGLEAVNKGLKQEKEDKEKLEATPKITEEQFNSMSYEERVELHSKDKATYDKLNQKGE